ncbi:MAG: cysteine desulfurase family protein [candidate division Zixibacteria bacterium]|nr:cysteine desulfurase family protein [candidate division Zixibacteria bacterium]
MQPDAQRDIYFDHAATTPVDSRVVEAMLPYFAERFGNPSSHVHSKGVEANQELDQSRASAARLINAPAETIIFTSGATEANNLAICGYLEANRERGKHLIISEIEHYSVINLCLKLRREGYDLTLLPVDKLGLVHPDKLHAAVRRETALISIQHASSEIGTIQNIKELAAIAGEAGVFFHSDAAASAGNIPVDVVDLGVDALTVSAHNFYGPKGVGALYLRPGAKLEAQIIGGFQERGYRSGTENLAGIVGMAKAAELALAEMPQRREHLTVLQQRLWNGLSQKYEFLHFTGHPSERLPGHVSFWLEYIEGESLLLFLNVYGIQTASGSACASNMRGQDEHDLAASHVLTAVGVPAEYCSGSLTVSMGKDNTEDEVDYFLQIFPQVVERLLAMSPLWADKLKGKNPYQ